MAATQQTRILNCIPSRKIEDDWIAEEAFGEISEKNLRIPLSVDLREDKWWKIGDQGATGSCVGWAAADSVMRWHMVKKGTITQQQLLSVRFIWMASKETDEFNNRATTFLEKAGTSLKAALEIGRKYGNVLETDLPFSGTLTLANEHVFYGNAATRRINSYYNLVAGMPDKLASFRRWIAAKGPVLTRLTVDSEWRNVGVNGKLANYNAATANGGHAIALVGYTKDYFIVRNSWGTSWAHKGYAYASNAYAKAAFTEGYGITM
ncbi:MAG: C1 family peptidase [Chitinophagales bacterium]|nr:C1 family peptidase [Chitinophagales bacterium]